MEVRRLNRFSNHSVTFAQQPWQNYSLSFLCLINLQLNKVNFFLYFSNKNELNEKDYLDKTEVVFQIKKIKAYPTAYLWLNRSGRKMIKEHPFLGVGFGNFAKEVDQHKLEGFYPKNLSSLRAHDNYIGLIAQYGLGFLLFLATLIFSFRKIL